MRSIPFLLAVALSWGCATTSAPAGTRPVGHVLTESEAVARAEEFVRLNGYVRTRDADPKRMQVERALTFGSTPEELLPQRAGTLLPRACGILAEAVRGFENGKGWSVVFCYNPSHSVWSEGDAAWRNSVRERSRVVVMDLLGTDIFIPHPDFSLTGHGIKRLPGMDDFDRMLEGAAEPGVAADRAAPGR